MLLTKANLNAGYPSREKLVKDSRVQAKEGSRRRTMGAMPLIAFRLAILVLTQPLDDLLRA